MECVGLTAAKKWRETSDMVQLARRQQDDIAWRLRSLADATDLFAKELSALSREELRVLHLDEQGYVLGLSAGTDGDPEKADLPVREIVSDALALGARALLLAHNHPSGDPTPSRADKLATRRLAEAARGLEIRLLDHLVFAGGHFRSFRQMGLL
jgi:DNA repair protein RadC